MALGAVLNGTAIHSTTNTTTYAYSASLTAGQVYLLFSFVSHASAGPLVTPTAPGETFNEILNTGATGGVLWSSNTRRSQAWWFTATSSGAETITLTAAAATTSCEAVLVEVADVNPTTPVVQAVWLSAGASLSQTIALAAFASADNRPLSFVTCRSGSANTAEVGYTVINSGTVTAPTSATLTQWHATVADTNPTTSFAANQQSGGVALELNQAAVLTGSLAAETDTGNVGTPYYASAVGTILAETDTGTAGTFILRSTGAMATETDEAFPGGRQGSTATETDTGQAGVVTQVLLPTTGTQATETDTANVGSASLGAGAFGGGPFGTEPFGSPLTVAAQALETDEALVGALILTWAGTQAETTDTANTAPGAFLLPGTLAEETDTADTGAAVVDFTALGTQVVETDTANVGELFETDPPVQGQRGQETDDGQMGSLLVTITGVQAVDISDIANAGSFVVGVPGAQASELDEGAPGQAFGSVIAITGVQALEGDSGLAGTVTTPPATTYLFSPPTIDVLSPIAYELSGRPHAANAQFQHYKSRAVGQTVVKIDGAYQVTSYPTGALLETSTETYIGGHVYEVDGATALALTAAGLFTLGEGDDEWDGYPNTDVFPDTDLYPSGG